MDFSQTDFEFIISTEVIEEGTEVVVSESGLQTIASDDWDGDGDNDNRVNETTTTTTTTTTS